MRALRPLPVPFRTTLRRLSRKTLLVGGPGLIAVGFLGIRASTTYPIFLVGTGVVGLGSGLYLTADRTLDSDLFVRRRGRAFGLHTASCDLGDAAAAGIAVVALAVAKWPMAFVPFVFLYVLTLLVAYALYAFTWRSITGFLPTFLQAEKGFTVGVFAAGRMSFPPVMRAFLVDLSRTRTWAGTWAGCGPSTSASGVSARRTSVSWRTG